MSDITRRTSHPNLHVSVTHGDIIFLCGLAGDDDSLPVRQQTEQITRKIDDALAQCGSDKSRILSATIYLTEFSLKDEMNVAWQAWLDRSDMPARMTIAGVDLGGPLVEIVVTAARA